MSSRGPDPHKAGRDTSEEVHTGGLSLWKENRNRPGGAPSPLHPLLPPTRARERGRTRRRGRENAPPPYFEANKQIRKH